MQYTGMYREIWRTGELEHRADEAKKRLDCCDLCSHECRVNRRKSARGVCRIGEEVRVSGHGPHFGEEDVLVGSGGSGTIFFAGCNLRCVFCQNWEISHLSEGEAISISQLAGMMVELQSRGCHNINLVTPTPYLPQILSALQRACDAGLSVPLVYNCGGYESLSALKLLDGIVDIYMPDVKFSGDDEAYHYTGAKGYWNAVQSALIEMHRQVGDLAVNEDGLAWKGLLVRHLVLPGHLAGTEEVMRFLAETISPDTCVNIMGQYYPAYRAGEHPPLDRPIREEEFEQAVFAAKRAGLHRLV